MPVNSTDSAAPPSPQTYRLITRSDLDGIVSAVLLQEVQPIDEIVFAHPKDMQDGIIPVTARDITANLPYVEGVHLAFDHHYSESLRLCDLPENFVLDPSAPSAARAIYNYYGGKFKFPRISQEMMAAVDRSDAAQFTLDEVLDPQGWVLLSFITDSRTGLGRFRNFHVSNYQLMLDLVRYCREHAHIDEILALPDVRERVDLYREHQPLSRDQIQRCTHTYGRVAVVDLRGEETIYACNRFMVYALYPECNLSIHVMWGMKRQNTVLAVGKSILNRTSNANVGELMLRYEGGGHINAGTCQVANEDADRVLKELLAKLADGVNSTTTTGG